MSSLEMAHETLEEKEQQRDQQRQDHEARSNMTSMPMAKIRSHDDPHNWPKYHRFGNVIIVSILTLMMNLSATIFAPGSHLLMKDFGITNTTLGTFTVSIYMFGLVCGPLVIAPLSELYGRLPIYHTGNLVFLGFTIGCAKSTNTPMFMVFRFIAGCAGSVPLSVGGGTIADIMKEEERGIAMGLYAMGPSMGPALGPLVGGFVAQNIGWRWTFWVLAIAHGTVSVISLVFLRETSAKVLSRQIQRRSKKEGLGEVECQPTADKWEVFARSLTRPVKMLLFSPIVLLLSLSVAFAFGLTFLLLTTFSTVFEGQYGFSLGISGVSYLGFGVGMFFSTMILIVYSDRVRLWHFARNFHHPEHRLWSMVLLYPFTPVGLFWYGWSVTADTHWIVPIIGTSLIGFGTNGVMNAVQFYLVETFGSEAAASALAANTVFRSISAALLPLAGPPLYKHLGIGWGNSLLGFLAVIFVPVPLLFYKYGIQLRKRYVLKL